MVRQLNTPISAHRTMDERDDVTIAVLSRSLTQTSSPRIFADLAHLIYCMHYPPGSMLHLLRYRSDHPPPRHIIQSLLGGVPGNSPQLLIDCIAVQLSKCQASDVHKVLCLIPTLMPVPYMDREWSDAPNTFPHDAFMGALFRSTTFLTSLFSRIHTLSLAQTNDVNDAICSVLRVIVMAFLYATIPDAGTDHGESLVKACAHSNLFEALENMLALDLTNNARFGRWRL